jgi:hypothetical protein
MESPAIQVAFDTKIYEGIHEVQLVGEPVQVAQGPVQVLQIVPASFK